MLRMWRGRHAVALFIALVLAWVTSAAWVYAIPIKIDPAARDWRHPNGVVQSTTGQHDPADVYRTANGWGICYTLPQHPVPAERLPSIVANFHTVLASSPSKAGWTVRTDDRAITDDTFLIRTYDAQGSAGSVGADFDVAYRPSEAQGSVDPTILIHWIQVVTNNHKLDGAHGQDDNKVDVTTGQNDPFYDTAGLANARDFFDAPRRGDVEEDHLWRGVLMLATGIPKQNGDPGGEIILYPKTAIFWGWANVFYPNVNKVALHEQAHEDWLDELPQEEFVVYHDAFHEELDAVPEPSSVMLIVTAAMLAVSRHRMARCPSN